MRSGAAPVAGWGAAVVVLGLMGWLGFGLESLPVLLLTGAGAAAVLFGAWAGVAERRDPHEADRVEVLVEGSWATFAVALGLTAALVGVAAFGPALFWPGVGLMAFGVAGLVREARASRRLLRSAGARGPVGAPGARDVAPEAPR